MNARQHAVGLVGLGRMGLPIGRRLATGVEVHGYDLGVDSDDVAGAGLAVARSLREIAARCETVMLCLPRPEVNREVVGQLASSSSDRTSVVIELSTVGVSTAEACAARLAEVGIAYVDSPVSGGPPRAAAGDLTLMVAAPDPVVDRIRPLLELVGSRIFTLGDRAGLGQAMKAVNNVVSSTAMAITCEAVAAGAHLGLDPAQMIDVLNVSTGRTTASSDKFPRSVLPGRFEQGALGETVRKDARLFLELADQAGLAADTARAASRLWDAYVTSHPREDFSRIYPFIASGGSAETGAT